VTLVPARMTRIPSRSTSYKLGPFALSRWSLFGDNLPPGGTMNLRFFPSGSARSMEPSFMAEANRPCVQETVNLRDARLRHRLGCGHRPQYFMMCPSGYH